MAERWINGNHSINTLGHKISQVKGQTTYLTCKDTYNASYDSQGSHGIHFLRLGK